MPRQALSLSVFFRADSNLCGHIVVPRETHTHASPTFSKTSASFHKTDAGDRAADMMRVCLQTVRLASKKLVSCLWTWGRSIRPPGKPQDARARLRSRDRPKASSLVYDYEIDIQTLDATARILRIDGESSTIKTAYENRNEIKNRFFPFLFGVGTHVPLHNH